MKYTLIKYFDAIGMSLLLTAHITLAITFIIAYLTPDYSVVVYINKVGEANLELGMLLLSPIFIITTFVRWYKNKC